MFCPGEHFLAGLDVIQASLHLKLDQHFLLDRRFRPGRDEDVERLPLGQHALEPDADQIEGRLELHLRPQHDQRDHALGHAQATVGVPFRIVFSLRSLQGQAGPREQHMVERPLRLAGLVGDAEVADLEQHAVLGVVAFERPLQSAHTVLHVATVGQHFIRHGEGLVGNGREAVVGNHEDRGIVRHFPQHAAHVLPQNFPHRGVVDERQVVVVVVQVLVGEVEDHHVDGVRRVVCRNPALNGLILALDLELHRQPQVRLQGVFQQGIFASCCKS